MIQSCLANATLTDYSRIAERPQGSALLKDPWRWVLIGSIAIEVDSIRRELGNLSQLVHIDGQFSHPTRQS
jgi:hypothetical protein